MLINRDRFAAFLPTVIARNISKFLVRFFSLAPQMKAMGLPCEAPGAPHIVICPGTSSATKEYPTAPLAIALKEGLAGESSTLVVAGSRADDRITKPLLAALSHFPRVVDATGLLTLPQHVALIAGARMVVTMDSCHVHIAGAFGVPCVCILGGGQ